ncbi:hypothetical protein SS50377_26139 [Spironucleus salmonicida]|uniref:Uncharacterized protein n=1 Tax=Spironucleus salmonicida TaxID=348837 RepID=V6LP20_9EUKA|nr:hypothetical protein SS50377_26139 [Spironucleus salmonicida]|eukprot:EST46345.1 Hypothetical protein SS50377_13658 [Spironucleus salmonicida]
MYQFQNQNGAEIKFIKSEIILQQLEPAVNEGRVSARARLIQNTDVKQRYFVVFLRPYQQLSRQIYWEFTIVRANQQVKVTFIHAKQSVQIVLR